MPSAIAEAETVAEEEISAVLQGFRQRARIEEQRLWDATDSEHWVCLCFQTREQKEEFLRKTEILGPGDLADKYVDGMKAAKALGLKLESRVPQMPRLRPDARLTRYARDNE